jgi:hypothetical protein
MSHLEILAQTIKDARCYKVAIREQYNCIEVSAKHQAHGYLVSRILDEADMNGLYTVREACGSVFVRAVVA